MKIKLLIIIFGFLFCIPVVNAQNDNLEPVESIFDDYDFLFEYYSHVRKILMNGMSDYPEVRFLIIPSFSPEEVVSIAKENEVYFIVHHKMEKSIWYTEKNKNKIQVQKKKVEISKPDVLLFKELFKQAIKNRKYPDKEIMGNDGVNYYFSVADAHPLKTGTVWSPKPGSKMDRLKEIGYALINLVKETDSGRIAKPNSELIEQIKKLTIELK
ncbi:hypothetical protein ATE92_0086 [Ulvibacter sp. MAR_2010_11]|uniref:hypothetical protein n=1 Tax=Ulvibacter sp. MAR_2010_11 TaxID=1250229 RepID=UPI000CBF8E80|nr:hypothetical protein [Ulvibacter sp. MAR_2010_11]PKA81963.1 hypothetical protein ATE92_0086 [Ulvibacter sp. MAR_2010_11]